MAFARASRSFKALLLGSFIVFQPFPSVSMALGRPALDGLFDGGPAGLLPSPADADRPASVPARAVLSAISFNGLDVPGHIFSRERRISETLVSIIDKAQRTMDLALYIINLPDVAEAIIRAKERGVAVRIIVDRNNAFPEVTAVARSRELDLLIENGVTIRALRGAADYGIMHNKFGIYDGKLLSAGSYNWTAAADARNFENALFRDDPELLTAFQGYWDWMWAKATPLSALADPPEEVDRAPRDSKPSLSFKGQAWPAFAFSPLGGTEELLIKAIDLCSERLDIAMFSFFSENIGWAVVKAHQRGVAVRVIMDRGQGRNTPVTRLFRDNGIDLRLSSGIGGTGVLHHKFGLFDGEMLETGSFNYSNNAEYNSYENSIFSTRADDIQGFSGEFEFLYGQATAPSSDELAVSAAFASKPR